MMNRSIQYSEVEGFRREIGMQIDKDTVPREISFQFVQTDKVEMTN